MPLVDLWTLFWLLKPLALLVRLMLVFVVLLWLCRALLELVLFRLHLALLQPQGTSPVVVSFVVLLLFQLQYQVGVVVARASDWLLPLMLHTVRYWIERELLLEALHPLLLSMRIPMPQVYLVPRQCLVLSVV